MANTPNWGNANQHIKNSKRGELNGVGHIPHTQAPELFKKTLFCFL